MTVLKEYTEDIRFTGNVEILGEFGNAGLKKTITQLGKTASTLQTYTANQTEATAGEIKTEYQIIHQRAVDAEITGAPLTNYENAYQALYESMGESAGGELATLIAAYITAKEALLVAIQAEVIEDVIQTTLNRVPGFKGSFTFASGAGKDTYYTGAVEGDYIVCTSTTQGERGIYQFNGTSWAKISPLTYEQISACFIAILNAIKDGYGTSADYIPGSTAFETLLVNFLFVQSITLGTGGVIQSADYTEDASGFPLTGFKFPADGILRAAGAKLDILEVRGVKWVATLPVGTAFDLTTLWVYPNQIIPKGVCALNATLVAVIVLIGNDNVLYFFQWNGSTFTVSGSSISITEAIEESLPIDISRSSEDTFMLGGRYWNDQDDGVLVNGGGSWTRLTNTGIINITAVSVLYVAVFENTTKYLCKYYYTNNTFTKVGNNLTLSTTTAPVLATLSATDIAVVDHGTKTLRTYRWNSTNNIYELVGNALTISDITTRPAMTAISEFEVSLFNPGTDEIKIYRFNGTNWAQTGDTSSMAISAGSAVTALSGVSGAILDPVNKTLQAISFSYSLAAPYRA